MAVGACVWEQLCRSERVEYELRRSLAVDLAHFVVHVSCGSAGSHFVVAMVTSVNSGRGKRWDQAKETERGGKHARKYQNKQPSCQLQGTPLRISIRNKCRQHIRGNDSVIHTFYFYKNNKINFHETANIFRYEIIIGWIVQTAQVKRISIKYLLHRYIYIYIYIYTHTHIYMVLCEYNFITKSSGTK